MNFSWYLLAPVNPSFIPVLLLYFIHNLIMKNVALLWIQFKNKFLVQASQSPCWIIGCVALPWHFEFYILKFQNVKFFFINFLDELGNFKQKNFYTSKCKIFLHFKATDPMSHPWNFLLTSNFEFVKCEVASMYIPEKGCVQKNIRAPKPPWCPQGDGLMIMMIMPLLLSFF